MTRFAHWLLNKQPPIAAQACAAALSLLLANGASALEWGDKVQVHGFASQAFTMTSDNQFFGDTTEGSLGYTELGLNGSYRPLASLLFSAQALSRRAGEVDDGNIRLDYGFADYTAISSESRRWGIRVGRIKNPYGLYNETRDVAFTRPTIFLPQSIYFDQARPLILSSDGVGLYGEERTSFGNFSLKLHAVRLNADNTDTELAFMGFKTKGHFENDLSFVGQILYEYDEGRVRTAISAVDATLDYKQANNDFLQDGSVRITPLVFSFQYNAENWSFTSEYWRQGLDYRDLGPAFPDLSVTAESYYLQGSYRFYPAWEVLLRYDVFYRNKDDKNGKKLAQLTGLPDYRGFAKDWTLGLRWDVSTYAMVRAEYHRIDGAATLPLQDNPDPSQWVKKWNMFSIQLSIRF